MTLSRSWARADTCPAETLAACRAGDGAEGQDALRVPLRVVFRSVPLPAGAWEDTIAAEYVDGILTINILAGEVETTGKPILITVAAAKKK